MATQAEQAPVEKTLSLAIPAYVASEGQLLDYLRALAVEAIGEQGTLCKKGGLITTTLGGENLWSASTLRFWYYPALSVHELERG